MRNPKRREDVSKFLVHLARDYDDTDAEQNLLSMLRAKSIHARNAHCLFKYEFDRLHFTDALARQFNTVCLTEAPLAQIRRLVGVISGRQIALRPYGLVFQKETLLQRGANPAIYLNASGTKLREYLLARFRQDFQSITSLRGL